MTGAIDGTTHVVDNYWFFSIFCNFLIILLFSIMQSRVRRLIPDSEIDAAKITIHSRMDLPLQEVRTYPSPEQFKMLEAQTWMSKYFALEQFEWSGQVVHNLIMRIVGDPVRFCALMYEMNVFHELLDIK